MARDCGWRGEEWAPAFAGVGNSGAGVGSFDWLRMSGHCVTVGGDGFPPSREQGFAELGRGTTALL